MNTAASQIATDNFRTLALICGTTTAAIRDTATDLGLRVAYSPTRRTWFLDEDAATVRRFNEHLAETADDRR